jgi:hypothetical protein
MKKIYPLAFILVIISSVASAQTTTSDPKKANLVDRAGDHFMVQFSSDHWANMPDSIGSHQKGFSRGLNIYLMIDKPFKTDPRYSVAFGIGVSSSNIFFQNMEVGLTATSSTLPFPAEDSATHFKKYKLETSFLEVPVELRYTAHPEKENKSLKFAVGLKVGLMLDAHTKAKDQENGNGTLLNDFIQKESRTAYFNTTRLCGTARVGYGNFSLFGSYQITSLLVSGAGPDIKFFQIGLCLSGL